MFLSNRRQLLAAIAALVAVIDIQPISCLESELQISSPDQSRFELGIDKRRELKSDTKKSKESKSKSEKSSKHQKSSKESKKNSEAEEKPKKDELKRDTYVEIEKAKEKSKKDESKSDTYIEIEKAEEKSKKDESKSDTYIEIEKAGEKSKKDESKNNTYIEIEKADENEKNGKAINDEIETANISQDVPSSRIFEQDRNEQVTSRIFEDVEYQKDENGRDRVASTPGSRTSIVRENVNNFDSMPTTPPAAAPGTGTSSSGVNRGSSSLAGSTPSPTSANRNPQNNPATSQNASRPGSGSSLNPDEPTSAPIRQFNNPGSLPVSSIPRPGLYPTSSTGESLRAPTLRPTYRKYPTSPPGPVPALNIPIARPPSYLVDDSDAPSDGPSTTPSDLPSSSPSFYPTPEPTKKPSKKPTRPPTPRPTWAPLTQYPTHSPTISPAPTASPTERPTKPPTKSPTRAPSSAPTSTPTANPTSYLGAVGRPGTTDGSTLTQLTRPPTNAPIVPSESPSISLAPSISSSPTSSDVPSAAPIVGWTDSPTVKPTTKQPVQTRYPTWSPTTWMPTISNHPTIDYPFYINSESIQARFFRPSGGSFFSGSDENEPVENVSSQTEVSRPGSTYLGGSSPAPTQANRNPQNNPANNQNAVRPGSGSALNAGDPTPAPIRQVSDTIPVNTFERPGSTTTSTVIGNDSLRAPTLRPTVIRTSVPRPLPIAGIAVDRPGSTLTVKTPSPSRYPSQSPSELPSGKPTLKPTGKPTTKPSKFPTHRPTPVPTRPPLTDYPTFRPTISPKPTPAPTDIPTMPPTKSPTESPSAAPTLKQTPSPTTYIDAVGRPGTPGGPFFAQLASESTTHPTTKAPTLPSESPSTSSAPSISDAPSISSVPTALASESPSKMPTVPTQPPKENTPFPTWEPTTWLPTTSNYPTIDFPFYLSDTAQGRYIGRPTGSSFSDLEEKPAIVQLPISGSSSSGLSGSGGASTPSGVNRGSGSSGLYGSSSTPAPTTANRNPQNNPGSSQNASRPGAGSSFGAPTTAPVRQWTGSPISDSSQDSSQSTPLNSVQRPGTTVTTSLDDTGTGESLRSPTLRPTYRRYPTKPPGSVPAFTIPIARPPSYLVDDSDAPSDGPSMPPSDLPSARPSLNPTPEPTKKPSKKPTRPPTPIPTWPPLTQYPTLSPTISPEPTRPPTNRPTLRPTKAPTASPSGAPSSSPTAQPTSFMGNVVRPGSSSTSAQSVFGPRVPTAAPSDVPSDGPSMTPTFHPTTWYPTTWIPTTAEIAYRKETSGHRISNDDKKE